MLGAVVEPTLDEQFFAFHRDHPEVFTWLKHRALELASRGVRRYSIRTLWEALRWETDRAALLTRQPAAFKLNNNYHSRYARLIMAAVPELDGFFETRQLGAGKGEA